MTSLTSPGNPLARCPVLDPTWFSLPSGLGCLTYVLKTSLSATSTYKTASGPCKTKFDNPGILAEPQTEQKTLELSQVLTSMDPMSLYHNEAAFFWIGVYFDSRFRLWRYESGRNVTYTNWAPREPPSNSTDKCVAVSGYNEFKWVTIPCQAEGEAGAICQFEPTIEAIERKQFAIEGKQLTFEKKLDEVIENGRKSAEERQKLDEAIKNLEESLDRKMMTMESKLDEVQVLETIRKIAEDSFERKNQSQLDTLTRKGYSLLESSVSVGRVFWVIRNVKHKEDSSKILLSPEFDTASGQKSFNPCEKAQRHSFGVSGCSFRGVVDLHSDLSGTGTYVATHMQLISSPTDMKQHKSESASDKSTN